jgi:hypothetical protein
VPGAARQFVHAECGVRRAGRAGDARQRFGGGRREKPQPLALPTAINHSWSMDFMHEQLADGRGIRIDFIQPGQRPAKR